jgi:signal transduction histidine kinase
MASAPSDPSPVLGRIDRDGRLVAADAPLERLQVEAGSSVGASLALPQLAAVVRVAQRLKIPISRRVLAAGREQDVDMWVRAVPEGDEIALTIEHWNGRPASPPRLVALAAVEHEKLVATQLTWSVDDQLRLVSVAPELADRLSIAPDAAGGQPLTKLVRLEEDETGEMPLLAALAARTAFSDQRVTIRSTGEPLVLSAEAAVGPDGSFAGFKGSAVATSESETAVPATGQPAVDNAIHTALRTPLDSIVSSAEQMIARSGDSVRSEYAEYASDIATAARHLLSVIRSLGDQADASGPQRVDLAELTSEAVGLIETAAADRHISIGVQPLETFPARGEARSVIQILVNLIANAIRYSDQHTAVTISFDRSGNAALVHVADKGPGIDAADQERIFEPYEQGNGGGQGSGLGLAIARRLARAMGGDIQLQSEPGKGSRFTLALPAG